MVLKIAQIGASGKGNDTEDSNSKFQLMAPLLPENAGPVSGKNSSLKRGTFAT
jgi:hypothetical protein